MHKDTKTALRTHCGKNYFTSGSDPHSYEATKAVAKKDRPEKNSETVLQRSWAGIPLKPREFFWAFLATALVAS